MGGFEDSHVVAQVGARCQPQPPHQPRAEVGDKVAVEVGQHQYIELLRLFHQLHAEVVHDSILELDVGIFLGNISGSG
ncbi:hypothetical protein ES708_28844 [subsurface metagenome]